MSQVLQYTRTGDDASSNYMCFTTSSRNNYLGIVISRNSENILVIIVVKSLQKSLKHFLYDPVHSSITPYS